MKKILTIRTLALVAFLCSGSLTLSACSDKDDDKTIIEEVVTAKEIAATASTTAPAYLNLKYNLSVTTEKDAQLSLSGMYGSTLAANAEYKLGYFDSETLSLATLKLSDLKAQTLTPAEKLSIQTSEANAASAWLLYNMTTHAVSPKPNRFIVITKGSTLSATAAEVYVIKLKSVDVNSPAATYTFDAKYLAN